MQITSIVGARPQFIKAAPVCQALKAAGIEERLVHTGQHYDELMSDVFFRDLPLPVPHANLEIGSGGHGWQTGHMLARLEACFLEHRCDGVLVYGDTNSTLAGALAACKLRIPLFHVEAGLRSYNRTMPEEHNRVLTDHCADLLLCPTTTAVENLRREGIETGVHLVGDTMLDAVQQFSGIAERESGILLQLGIQPGSYALATIHRPYNTDEPGHFAEIVGGLLQLREKVVFPIHPRTRKSLQLLGNGLLATLEDSDIMFIDPVSYLDMLKLEGSARLVITDSGGMQKEAFFLQTPVLTIRPETEWPETLLDGWNRLVPADRSAIAAAAEGLRRPDRYCRECFGSGQAASMIAATIGRFFDAQ